MTTAMAAKFVKRGKSYWLNDEQLPSVTTILREGFPAPALVTWAARETAGYAVDQWDLLAAMTTSQRLRELEGAAWKRRDAAAVRGTTIHEYGQKLVAGEPVQVPEELAAVVQAYARWLDRWHVVPSLVETPVVHVDHGWAGTIDLRAMLLGDQDWLLDLKTGKGVYESHALQLCAYARASHYLALGGQLRPWEPPMRVGAVHITPDGCDLLPVDWSESSYRVFRHAKEVARYAHEASAAYKERRPWPVGVPLIPPAA